MTVYVFSYTAQANALIRLCDVWDDVDNYAASFYPDHVLYQHCNSISISY